MLFVLKFMMEEREKKKKKNAWNNSTISYKK